jgi:hypothetical protein
MINQKMWLNKFRVLKDTDIPELEAAAASNEFKHGIERSLAESEAHKAYLRGHATRVMAHHLMGAKLANAINDEETALRHGNAYSVAAEHAGFDAGSVPPEVKEGMKGCKGLYAYRPHPSDVFFMPEDEEGAINTPVQPHPDNAKMAQILEGLKKLQALIGG